MPKTTKNLILIFVLFSISCFSYGQATLTIKNNSMRSMTVKIMKGSDGNSSFHQMVNIAAHSSFKISFSSTGYYFTKTKAELVGKVAIYQKGKPFHVVNDNTGYSVMTLTFSITESSIPQVAGGELISKSEFDKNY